MLEFWQNEIQVSTVFISSEQKEDLWEQMVGRYKLAKTVPGTHSFHCFIPINQFCIGTKWVSKQNTYDITFNLSKQKSMLVWWVCLDKHSTGQNLRTPWYKNQIHAPSLPLISLPLAMIPMIIISAGCAWRKYSTNYCNPNNFKHWKTISNNGAR